MKGKSKIKPKPVVVVKVKKQPIKPVEDVQEQG